MHANEVLIIRLAHRHGRQKLLGAGTLDERLIEPQACRINGWLVFWLKPPEPKSPTLRVSMSGYHDGEAVAGSLHVGLAPDFYQVFQIMPLQACPIVTLLLK